jgi:ubiquitin-protein ligase
MQEDDLFLWHAVLDGPRGTAWEGNSFLLEIHVPEDYPRRPPDRVRFLTEIAHPQTNAAGVPHLDFLNARSPGSAGKRMEERDRLEKEISHFVGVKSQGANDMASTSVGQAETGCPRSKMQGSGLGQSKGAEKCTADEIVEAADRLLSAASLGTETGTENGRPNGPDGSSESGDKMRGTTWDPYQGLAFVLKSVQRLLSDIDTRRSD